MAKVGSRGSLFNLMKLKHRSVVINHKRILKLWHTSITLVPATETLDYLASPTELPMPTFCQVFGISGGAGPYGNQHANQCLHLAWGGDDLAIAYSTRDVPSVEEDAGEIMVQKAFKPPHSGGTNISAAFSSFGAGVETNFNGQLQDNGLILSFENINPGHELTGGHPDDKLIVFLTYYVAKLN